MQETLSAPTRELLTWVATRPRTYRETIEAWRTHCPRLSIWDDAVIEALVCVNAGMVELTPRGQALLDEN